jgi:hypothetical protein
MSAFIFLTNQNSTIGYFCCTLGNASIDKIKESRLDNEKVHQTDE